MSRTSCKPHVISLMTLQQNTSYTSFSRTFLEVYLNGVFMFEQSITQTTGKLFVFWMYWMMMSQFLCCTEMLGHSLQTYGFTAWCRWTCTLSWPLLLNFLWQMSHVNQVPSLCDFSRCVLSWSSLLKQSEQCLHEYGFASVWIRTWYFSSMWSLYSFPQ